MRRGEKEMKLRTQLAELAISDDEGAESSQALNGLIPVFLGGCFIDWGVRALYARGPELLGLPDEVLKNIALILGKEEILGESDDLASISNQRLSFCGKPARRRLESLGLEEAVQGNIDLFVLDYIGVSFIGAVLEAHYLPTYRRNLSGLEGAVDAVELELGLDVVIPALDVRRSIH